MKICLRLLIFELLDCTLRIVRGYDFSTFLIMLFLDRYLGGFDPDLRVRPLPVCLVIECPPGKVSRRKLIRLESCTVIIGRNDSPLCPVEAILHFFAF